MRLHLPSSLRKSLLLAISTVAATLGSQTANASVLFDGVGIQTYADFGQNCGRFVAGEVNAMLKAIRENEGGIVITYQASQYGSYTISSDQGMIDFASASSNPVAAAVGYAYLATVSHNGIIDPTYTALEVGGQNAVRYSSIDFRRGTPFHMEASTDYKIARLNKIVTDVQPSEFYSGTNPGAELDGKFLYRTGSGAMDLALIDEDGIWRNTREMDLPYSFATGGIVVVEWADNPTHIDEHDGNFGIFHHVNPKFAEEIAANPLPYRVRSGDSGSPTWVWNPDTQTYQYISAGQSGGQYFTQDRGDLKWSEYAIDSCGVQVELGTADHTITLGAVNHREDEIAGVGDSVDVSTTPYSGTMTYTDNTGAEKQQKYIGIETIQSGKHTWKDLSPVKDQDNWFNYGNEYFNVAKYGPTEEKPGVFSFADMFVTDNLIFEAGDGNTYNIVLDADVDLGIGYVQLSKAENVQSARFRLQSDNYVLDSAGFAIDAGVTLELDMVNPQGHMAEWRKAGAGNLTIIGSGDTNALLNVGGSGTVSLERKEGYAAYNVLASSGSTLVIDNLTQVYRDVTLGAGGATLDLNGNNFVWNNSASLSSDGFKSLHMLVEKDVVTNNSNKAITITIEDPGTEAFVGAFKDVPGKGAINVVYDSSSENPWVMNTVFTKLHNEGSAFTVENGSVILQGTNTVHGKQLLGRRKVNEFDWHYADAAMDVTVKDGAEFTLGSHARLTGNVTVEGSGVFTMTEYTTHRMEYMEGGVKMDDTYAYRDYFGLHGNVNLAGENSMFYVEFAPQHYYQDTDSESVYTGNITGSGGMVVDTAGGSLRLTNAGNDFTGLKKLERGTLVATSKEALGDTTDGCEWMIYDAGVLQVMGSGVDELLSSIDGLSNGVLALTQSETGDAPDLSGHQDLIIGAVGDIQFGVKGTQQTLTANDKNEWHLGGGGGTLYVNYKLDDASGVLVLGNQYTTGRVVLTNSDNNISCIELVGGVSLDYDTDDALGGADVLLQYGNRMMGSASLIGLVTDESEGAVLLDQLSDATIDLTKHGNLSLAADKTVKFTGTINLGGNNTYHFGGGGGHLVLDTVLANGAGGARNMVVDGQFYKPANGSTDEMGDGGDIIELKKALQITGDVTVQGFDFNKAPEDDPMYVLFHFSTATLQLSVNDALESVHSLVLADGGFVDMNGTTQTLHGFATEGSVLGLYGIVDNSDSQKSKLILDVSAEDEWERWSPIYCNLAAHELVKTGDGTLYLVSAVNESALFTIEDGTVEIYTNAALNSDGLTRVVGNGILDASGLEDTLDNKTIELNDGGTMLIGPDAISGRISANSGTGTIDALEGSANLAATIGAEADSTLVLRNGSFTLSTAQNNAEGGIIDLQGSTLSLSNTEGVSIGGTLKVSSSATVQGTVNGATHQLNRVEVANGVNLTVNANNKSSLWNIHALDGSGNVTWQPGTNADARLTLDGEGTLSGTLTVAGRANPQSAPGLVLAHDLAAQRATVSLQDNASMAVNTANARMAGLNGNASSAVYAYESAADTTLTTTGSGTYIYNGSIGGSAAMNIVMDGTGTQTYTGTVNAANVSALKGTLNLKGDHVGIAGNVTIARGATLSAENGLTLVGDQYLCSSGDTGNTGIVNGTVTFNGGGLRFDASGLQENSAALQFNGGSYAGDLEVNFTNTSYLTAGSTLTLTNGYGWNAGKLSATGLEYLNASFSMTGNNILQVSFTQKSGNCIWDGTASQHTWSNSAFGKGSVPGSGDTAVFNDSADSKNVVLNGYTRVASLLFDNTSAYTVDTAAGFLSATNLDLQGGGTVTLGEHVNITEEVVIADGTLVLRGANTLAPAAKVEGDGKLVLDTSSRVSLDGKLSQIGSMEVRSGTLSSTETLNTNELLVGSHAELITNQGTILTEGGTVQSSGTMRIDVANSTSLTTDIAAGADGTAGDLVKEGAGTLCVNSAVTANTVQVNAGRLEVNKAHLSGFLPSVKTVEVNAGASAYLGQNAQTTELPEIDTNFTVNGGTLQLALAQHATKVVTGELTITNGGTLKKEDGGLRFTGKATLGASAEDHVTLVGSWGKDGTIFDGVVEGAGHVKLQRGNNNVEQFTFNNAGNTFSGEIEATQGTTLVVGAQTALAKASGINLANTGTLMMADEKVDIKTLNGGGAISFSATETRTAATLNITDGGNFSGTVDAQISINKTGGGTLSLTGSSTQFSGALNILEGIVSLGSAAMDILNGTTSVFVDSDATLQLASAASVAGPMEIQGTLAMGGTISTRDSVQLGGDISVILGGEYEETVPGTRVYTVFSAAEGSTVTGWKNLSTANFSGIGSEARGVTFKELQVQDNKYQVVVSTENMRNTAITWSAEAAAGEWDVDKTSNFTEDESGARTIYMEGDTVSIASKADITMAAAVSLDTLQVKSGADATIHQSAEHTLTMQTLDVQGGGRIAVNSLNTRFAGAANVAENGRLEISISSLGNSASVTTLSGAGVVAFSNTASLDFGNNALAGGNVNASGFAGTIELGNGADTMRFRSTRVAGLDNRNTIELNDKAQFWMDNSNTAIASNLILHGNSGQSASSSWGGEGFGAVRGATEFNGSVAIDGNAMVSGASTITFNGAISGMGDDDTLTFGCYHSNQGEQKYNLAGENATELANMVVRKSGNNKTTVNVNRADGLADNVKFAVGTGENGIVNVNESNTVERLDSASGDGVVNIAQNSALQLKQGADFGGSLKMAEGDVTVTAKAEGGTFQAGARVQFSTGSDGSAAISGNGSTRLDNANIQLQEQGSQLKMNDLVLGTMSMLKAASSAGVEANNLVIEGQEGVNVEARDAITIKSASVLRRMGDPTLSMLVEDESFACTFDITNVQGVELAGECLTIDISSMYPELRVLSEEYTWLGISLGNGDHVSSLDSDMVVNLKLADNLICPAYYLSNVGTGGTKVALAQNGENVGMVFVALYAVPEPATSTLSLLALAALAARRRRKS